MIKFIYFQHHDAVCMSCFDAPRSPPAQTSALCGTAERVSAVRAGGASRTFCGAREDARGRGAQGAVAYPADSHAPARGEPRVAGASPTTNLAGIWIVLPPETGEQLSISPGLNDAPWFNHRRPGSLFSIVEKE
jgi:hypothetical protein